MKKAKRIILTTLATIGIVLAVLIVTAVVITSLPSVRQKLVERATTMLSEKLGTRVSIEHADIGILKGTVNLYGIEVDDQQKRKMLKVEELSANLRLRALLRKRIVVNEAQINGMNALLTKKTDSTAANYQFIIDAFKKEGVKEKRSKEVKEKKKLTVDVSRVKLNDIHVKYDKYDLLIGKADYQTDKNRQLNATINNLQAAWTAQKKKGPVDNRAFIEEVIVKQQGTSYNAEFERLKFTTDNHKPRKNTNKPKRGFFDLDHLNIMADISMTIDPTVKDTLKAVITRCKATDNMLGMDLRNLKTQLAYTKGTLNLRNTELQQGETRLVIGNAAIKLPNKKTGQRLAYSTGLIKGRVVLKDIARTFAPVLGGFIMPLHLNVNMSGNDSTISFRNIKIINTNKKLQIAANGDISHLKEKERLNIHFNIATMHAQKGIAEQIIKQFKVKKLMMKQLDNLGNLNYKGNLWVLWRKEKFEGVMRTAAGSLNFNFTLDESNKYVTGRASSTNLALGNVMELEKLGVIDASADFKIDISKARTAVIRRQKGGKLPIGTVNAVVNDCSYRNIHLRNLSADIQSDGAVASGEVMKHGRIRDLFFTFSFTDTDEMRKVKITHPGIKFHPLSEKNKQQREERRQQKKLEKEQKKLEKQQKKLEKEQKRQQKQLEKQQQDEDNQPQKKKKKFLIF